MQQNKYDLHDYNENDAEFAPVFIETAESTKYTLQEKQKALKESKMDKKRHDSDSDEEQQETKDKKELIR